MKKRVAALVHRLRSSAPTVIGAMVFFALWEGVGRAGWLGPSFPPLSEIASAFDEDSASALLIRSFEITTSHAFVALAMATVVALTLTVVSMMVPPLANGLNSLASSVYAIPSIAYAPILILIAGPSTTPIFLGIVSAFFPIFIAVNSELRTAPPVYKELSTTLGANRRREMTRISLPHAVPALVDGLRLGAPGALLGVIIGEWFGAPSGLGVVILSSLQNVRIPQLWASALLGAGISFIAYLALTMLHRAVRNRYAW